MSSFISKLSASLNKPCVDADRDVEIELTQADIDRGWALSAEKCAFANACNRQFNGKIHGVYFYKSTAYLQMGTAFVRFILPADMTLEIEIHDRRGTNDAFVMRPGVYKMKAPKGAQMLGAVRERSKKRTGRHEPAKVPSGITRKLRAVNVRQVAMPEGVKTKAQFRKWCDSLMAKKGVR